MHKKHEKVLQAITANFKKHVEPFGISENLSYLPILAEINGILTTIGYFHPRCYDDILKILNPSNQRPIGLS